MELNKALYENLLEQAKENPRLRQAMDLRTTSEDGSQRLINALIPGTQVPIHRHTSTTETAIILYGCIDEIYYDDDGNETARHPLHVGDGLQIAVGQFHTVEVHEPSILLEVKDGKYEPTKPRDTLIK
ncbi:MAG: WbuC family cupin fold metalloprotein [Bacteroides sp.]|nr:WbuC family cupin fold metalloprotein [Bacteroides sp.]MCM1447851.1 WbuC family cupin fold metalloprotein [Bacteroides sp.]